MSDSPLFEAGSQPKDGEYDDRESEGVIDPTTYFDFDVELFDALTNESALLNGTFVPRRGKRFQLWFIVGPLFTICIPPLTLGVPLFFQSLKSAAVVYYDGCSTCLSGITADQFRRDLWSIRRYQDTGHFDPGSNATWDEVLRDPPKIYYFTDDSGDDSNRRDGSPPAVTVHWYFLGPLNTTYVAFLNATTALSDVDFVKSCLISPPRDTMLPDSVCAAANKYSTWTTVSADDDGGYGSWLSYLGTFQLLSLSIHIYMLQKFAVQAVSFRVLPTVGIRDLLTSRYIVYFVCNAAVLTLGLYFTAHTQVNGIRNSSAPLLYGGSIGPVLSVIYVDGQTEPSLLPYRELSDNSNPLVDNWIIDYSLKSPVLLRSFLLSVIPLVASWFLIILRIRSPLGLLSVNGALLRPATPFGSPHLSLGEYAIQRCRCAYPLVQLVKHVRQASAKETQSCYKTNRALGLLVIFSSKVTEITFLFDVNFFPLIWLNPQRSWKAVVTAFAEMRAEGQKKWKPITPSRPLRDEEWRSHIANM